MFGSELPMQTWLSNLSNIIPGLKHSDFCIPEKINPGTDTYLVPSPDKQDLQFHFPVIIKSGIMDTFPLPVFSEVLKRMPYSTYYSRTAGLCYAFATKNYLKYGNNCVKVAEIL